MYSNNYKLLAETIENALAPIAKLYSADTFKDSFDALTSKMKELYAIMEPVYSSEHFKEVALQLSALCKNTLLNIELPSIPSNALESLSSIDLHNERIEINDENINQFSFIVDNGAIAMKALGEANIEQSENNYIDLPESLADLVASIDGSLELPKTDSNNVIRVKESSGTTNFWTIISVIVTIISIFVTIYIAYTSSISSSKQHSELMQEEQKQTVEAEKQTIELQKQTEQLIQFNKTIEQLQETIPHSLENGDPADKSSTTPLSQ